MLKDFQQKAFFVTNKSSFVVQSVSQEKNPSNALLEVFHPQLRMRHARNLSKCVISYLRH